MTAVYLTILLVILFALTTTSILIGTRIGHRIADFIAIIIKSIKGVFK